MRKTLLFFCVSLFFSALKAQDTIPVIVHIVHSGQAVGTFPNISQAQVMSQFKVLNDDYAGTGYGSWKAPGVWPPANTQIVFVPALYDPQGTLLAEPGIERIDFTTKGWPNPTSFTSSTTFLTYRDQYFFDQGNWPPSLYCNVWVSNASSSIGILGAGTFPGNSGLAWAQPSWNNTDSLINGVWVWARAFGDTGTLTAPYDLGRTATHEFGHHFGLLHPQQGCPYTGPYCADVPPIRSSYPFNCTPTFPDTATGCPGDPNGYMFMNFMSTIYCADSTIYEFTNCQGNAMRQAIQTSPNLSGLLTSNVWKLNSSGIHIYNNSSLKIAPNPFSNEVHIDLGTTKTLEVKLYDALGKIVAQHKNVSQPVQLTLKDLPCGVYQLLVNDGAKIYHAKVLKE